MSLRPDRTCLSTFRTTKGRPFSRAAIRALWEGHVVNPVLSIDQGEFAEVREAQASMMSIPGLSDKLLVRVERNRIVPSVDGARYFLKPIPLTIPMDSPNDAPANEHFSMQIASQVFEVETTASSIVFFANGFPAYLCKRFDVDFETGRKVHVEDFCQLSGRSELTHGPNYKTEFTYEAMGALIRKYCPTYRIELERFFRQLLFNYLIGNGNAHLGNFSIIVKEDTPPMLSPAYDLMNTQLHFPKGEETAMGIIEGGRGTVSEFYELANRLELVPKRVKKIFKELFASTVKVSQLMETSFLSYKGREAYREIFASRYRELGTSAPGSSK